MFRKFVFLVLIAAVAWLFDEAPSEARIISPNNPYRSFNISGINYGSMKWERTHRGQKTQKSYSRRPFRRWRRW